MVIPQAAKEGRIVVLVVIDYASIVLFFVLLASLLFLVMRQRPEKAGEVRARAQEMPSAIYTGTDHLVWAAGWPVCLAAHGCHPR